jgi:hypothetical protein
MKRLHSQQVLSLMLALLVMVIGIAVLSSASDAEAQQSSAIFSAVTGQVRIMNPGDSTYAVAQVGMRILEGADIVAGPGANAELRLPDGSTVLVAENTRFVATKLDFDAQNRMRSSFFHLATGKLRAIVAKAAAALVAARQSSFAITTPTAVAAVRGTTLYASVDPVTNQTTFLVTEGTAIIQVMVAGSPVSVTVTAGQVTTVAPGRAPSAPATATPAQQAVITSPNVPTTGQGTTILNAPVTQISVPSSAAVTVQVGQASASSPPPGPPPAMAVPPSVTVTPAPPAAITPTDVSQSKK